MKRTNIAMSKEEILDVIQALIRFGTVVATHPRIYPRHARLWEALDRALKRLS